MLEREHVGFGASGRNGGWCSGLLANSLDDARRPARPAGDHRHAAPRCTTASTRSAGSSPPRASTPSFAKGGTVTVARTPEQQQRLSEELLEARSFGLTTGRPAVAGARRAAAAMLRWPATRAALFTPHCAAVHPLRLVHGLARAAAAAGRGDPRADAGRSSSRPGRGRHRARARAGRRRRVGHRGLDGDAARSPPRPRPAVLADGRHGAARRRAVGGRSAWPGGRRSTTPATSSSTASAPPTGGWRSAGAARRTTSASRIDERFDRSDAVRDLLADALRELFPVLADVDVPFHWGGPLAVPRDWQWSVRLRPRRPGRATPVATSATASRRRTSPGARWPT